MPRRSPTTLSVLAARAKLCHADAVKPAAHIAFAIAIATVAAASAEPEPIVRVDNPAMVALALRAEGYRARLTSSDGGLPRIDSGTGGTKFSIRFYFCDDDAGCGGMLFTASFDLDTGIGLEEMNAWNRDRLIGRGFTDDECDPVIDWFVPVSEQMTERDFFLMIEDWGLALADFRAFIGFEESDPTRAVVTDCGGASDAA